MSNVFVYTIYKLRYNHVIYGVFDFDDTGGVAGVSVSGVSGDSASVVTSGTFSVGSGGDGVVISEVSVTHLLSLNVSLSKADNLTVDTWKSRNCKSSNPHSKESTS